MSHAIYTSLAAGTRSFEGLDIVANNLANSETPGFKAQRALFKVVAPDDAQQIDDPAASALAERYLTLDEVGHDMRAGAVVTTGNPAHVALDGEGFFSVEGPGGQPRYTRDGTLTLGNDGVLLHQSGGRLLSEGGQPLALGPGSFEIREDGTVVQGGQELGRLAVTIFDDPQALVREGTNLFSAAGSSGTRAAGETRIVQGSLEQSNVDPLRELVDLIRLSRFYQAYSQALKSVDETSGQLNNRVGRAPGT